ncbi:DoxX family protein [uncultured Christiangramia sp.]|uniref:DoxX family protein n=1 Tax=uncultured Christiangramia sp. TaxID=503836 RepID=UPI0025E002A9|nr:DoxX family protein [uncultured Christiangramia sp.]
MSTLTFLVYFSSISFLFFGISCFTTKHMKSEFVRYGLTSYLKLVGTLQILGAIGLLAGYYYEQILVISSAIGLAVLMIFGYGVRRKIKDNFIQSAPSFIYAIFNIYLAYTLYAFNY